MVSAINAALSGFAAATQRLNTTANNIANVNTTGYTPQEVTQSSNQDGGVTTQTRNAANPSVQRYDPTNPAADSNGLTQSPNVDVAQQLVQGNIASYDAKGNLAVLKTQEKLFQSVLNIVS